MKITTIWFDLETGGTEPHHPDIQLGAIAVDAGWNELSVFEEKIAFFEADCDPAALEINSYDRDTWHRDAKTEEEVVKRFAAWLRPFRALEKMSKAGKPYSVARLAGHNVARFDADRLVAMFRRHGEFLPAACFETLDTLQLARWRFRGHTEPANMRLETLAAHFGIDTPQGHDALGDVRTTIAVGRRLLYGPLAGGPQ